MIGEIFEALLEIVFESAIEGSKSSRIPKPVRIILKVFVIVIYVALIALFAFMAFGFLRSGQIGIGIFMLVLTIFFIAVVYFKIIKRRR